ncbi:hypothetical protein WMY93_011649 [Mugilogobius chulae]|uniref:Matrix remodeling-associated protein 8 n=1 Tax=Mugilogobius chulae TaxID=88201 RepID=A0AAW0P9A9_9GOBI
MVWTRDRIRDRQRVLHWTCTGPVQTTSWSGGGHVLGPGGDQRIYNSYNLGRVSISKKAFKDGNFSLVIKDVTMNDRGLYSCNLHHLYCHLYETVRVQLNVTKSRRKEQKYWDGQKAVFVVLLGSTVVLPCINRRSVWTDWSSDEEDQQVVHWDRQSPGVLHDRADRLVDLYASGEQRSYGPLFLRRKMNISSLAFAEGDFSLTISDLQPTDEGLYSCHLHLHHYCGLHERRQFQLKVEPAVIQPRRPLGSAQPRRQGKNSESPRVINVILPDQRHYFLLPVGYVLTSCLLLAFIVLIIILITRRRKRKGKFHPTVKTVSLRTRVIVEKNYKNNLLKEKVHRNSQPKVIDLDKEMEKFRK